MNICRYVADDGSSRWGLVRDNEVCELDGDPFGTYSTGRSVGPLASTRLAAPCEPTKVLCAGRNYRSLLAEQGREVPDEPFLFLKASTAVIGPDEPVLVPPGVRDVAHEGELAVVLGARISGVSSDDAAHAVLGYTCANDITVRDWQHPQAQWWRAKSADSHCPLGPWITPKLPGDGTVSIRTYVNGQLRQDGRSDDLVFGIGELIAHISRSMTLLPGDVILTGTPAGIRPIQPGDVMDVAVEGIGTLSNPVAAWPPDGQGA